MNELNAKRTAAFVSTIFALTETVRELREVPVGHLYAQVMGRITLPMLECLLSIIVESGVVERRGNLLVWKGAPPK